MRLAKGNTLKKLLIIDVAALSRSVNVPGLDFQPAEGLYPALTCPVQAGFRTAAKPDSHGMVANGHYVRELRRPMFWEQSVALVEGPRIWDAFRANGGTVGMMFWQQSLGEQVDLILSPQPIHKHHGGMIENCYAQPAGLYNTISAKLGRGFKLRDYWGPLAHPRVGDWIADAAAVVMDDESLSPDLLLTYLPTLDYDLQRYGPKDSRCDRSWKAVEQQLKRLCNAAERNQYDVLVFGDYAIGNARTPIYPNKGLRQAGHLLMREVKGNLYPDYWASNAFAVVDHELAHVYVNDARQLFAVRSCLEQVNGLRVLSVDEQSHLAHRSCGDLVLEADAGCWLAYPWWDNAREAPDYAAHVDIHNKPGYDPAELFWGRLPVHTCTDATRMAGSHGRTGPGREVVWASTLKLPPVKSILELSERVRDLLSPS